MLGTLINAGAVVAGSLLGLFIHRRLPRRLTRIAFQAIGLFTLFLGVSMALKTSNFLVMIVSLVVGAITGEALDLDGLVKRFGEWLKRRLGSSHDTFSQGFVTAFLLYCMGSMTILGAIEEGLGGSPNLLLAKSVLDGFSSIALAASLGIGVLFSALPLLAYQGGLTLFAGSLESVLTHPVINEVTAVGGILLLGLGITILEIREVRVLNMLPALLIAGLLGALFL
ncbi:MAG: DUF554 domain-containing protein [Thermoplasmatota archaeon]